jgi:phosphomevalonate kinase
LDELLNRFTAEEVWYAGIPGAGGNDAIFVIGPPDIDLKGILKERFCSDFPNLAILPVNIVPI